MLFRVAAAAVSALATLAVPSVEACTMIAVGKNATVDGSAIVAHTDDAGGGAADLRLVRVPAQDHAADAKRAVYNFFGGYPRVVSNERGPQYKPKDTSEPLSVPLGYIPQVNHTYAYFDQDYGMMNEVQLSIAESTSGARTVGWPSDVPFGKNLFGIAELTKVALERCDSARCAVKTMGDLAVEYGFYSEDSGDPAAPGYTSSAEALGIADKYGEVWVFHVLTGKDNSSAVWAAQRVPDDHATVIANGFIIREMDLDDPDNFLGSPNIQSFAQEMGWWTPEMGTPFDFTAAYGYKDTSPVRPLYVGRRVWRVYDLLAPSQKVDPTLGILTEYATYPVTIKPDTPVSVDTILRVLRDYYEGTPFDLTKGLAAGPFGNPIRFDGESKGVTGGWERPISMFRTIYSFVLQARGHLEDNVGGIMWYGQSTPHGSVYVPFSCAQNEVPESYLLGKESEFHQGSAWWAFEFVKNWSMLRFDAISKDVRAMADKLQTEAFALRKRIERHVETLNTTAEIDEYIETHSNAFASSVVARWWQFAWHLVGKFSDGYITTGESEKEMASPGYPKWWLEATEFASWPADSFSPREIVRQQMDKEWKIQTSASSTATRTTGVDQSNGTQPWGVVAAQVGGGVLCGVVIGAAFMWLVEKRRRSGYRSLA
jgi:dipeptidase